MSISLSLRFRIFARDGFACRYCGATPPTVTLEIDHIVPRSAGGDDSEQNLLTACWACNRGKSDRYVDLEWELHAGPKGRGPLDGETRRSMHPHPAYWVFRDEAGAYRTGEDYAETAAYEHHPYPIRLVRGAHAAMDSMLHDSNGTAAGGWQVVAGIYLPLHGVLSLPAPLLWVPAELVFYFVAAQGPRTRLMPLTAEERAEMAARDAEDDAMVEQAIADLRREGRWP